MLKVLFSPSARCGLDIEGEFTLKPLLRTLRLARRWNAPSSNSASGQESDVSKRTFYFLEDPGDSILTRRIESYSGRCRNPGQGLGEREGINIIWKQMKKRGSNRSTVQSAPV